MVFDPRGVKKILALRFRSIGDIILSFPAVETLRSTFPTARIDFVIDDVFEDLIHAHPSINFLILNKRRRDGMNAAQKLWHELKFIQKIRRQKYDLVVDLHCGPRSALLTLLSGAKYRAGNPAKLRGKLAYNLVAEPRPNKPHSTDVMLNIIRPLDPKYPKKKRLFLRYREEDGKYVHKFLRRFDIHDRDIVIMVHPGARVDIKRLPAQKMGEIVRWLTSELSAKIIYAGSDDDISAIADIVGHSGRPGLMATNLTLGQLSALIDSCDLYIGNDSGPMHMAAALGIPVVAFFGPSDPAVWGPVGTHGHAVRAPKMDCMPCDHNKCRLAGQHCMAQIKVENIKRAILKTMRSETTSKKV
ncbi:MAG: glycosyltransferase family 9 protein [Nitrospinota bacterium]